MNLCLHCISDTVNKITINYILSKGFSCPCNIVNHTLTALSAKHCESIETTLFKKYTSVSSISTLTALIDNTTLFNAVA